MAKKNIKAVKTKASASKKTAVKKVVKKAAPVKKKVIVKNVKKVAPKKIVKKAAPVKKKAIAKPIKKAVPKKKVAKKVVRKKVAKKKLTKIDYDKRYQAKKPGKRKSASGNTYYESRPNRSDKGKLLGIKNDSKILDDYKTILGKVSYYQNTIQMYRDAIKNYKTRGISPAQLLNLKLWIKTHSKLLSEYKIHAKQLKKLI